MQLYYTRIPPSAPFPPLEKPVTDEILPSQCYHGIGVALGEEGRCKPTSDP